VKPDTPKIRPPRHQSGLAQTVVVPKLHKRRTYRAQSEADLSLCHRTLLLLRLYDLRLQCASDILLRVEIELGLCKPRFGFLELVQQFLPRWRSATRPSPIDAQPPAGSHTSINSNLFSSRIRNCASRSRYVVGAGGAAGGAAGAGVSAIVLLATLGSGGTLHLNKPVRAFGFRASCRAWVAACR
jgi:hypothetical protein